MILVYILGHSFLYKLITFPYNFFDEELVDIYIAFLKSLALQVNSDTLKFFHNEHCNLPLFERAQ
jgi:protein CLEC16A